MFFAEIWGVKVNDKSPYGGNKSWTNQIWEFFGAQVKKFQLSHRRLLKLFSQFLTNSKFYKMSGTEAAIATEQPTAEELKGVKRAAEVSYHSIHPVIFVNLLGCKNAGSHSSACH